MKRASVISLGLAAFLLTACNQVVNYALNGLLLRIAGPSNAQIAQPALFAIAQADGRILPTTEILWTVSGPAPAQCQTTKNPMQCSFSAIGEYKIAAKGKIGENTPFDLKTTVQVDDGVSGMAPVVRVTQAPISFVKSSYSQLNVGTQSSVKSHVAVEFDFGDSQRAGPFTEVSFTAVGGALLPVDTTLLKATHTYTLPGSYLVLGRFKVGSAVSSFGFVLQVICNPSVVPALTVTPSGFVSTMNHPNFFRYTLSNVVNGGIAPLATLDVNGDNVGADRSFDAKRAPKTEIHDFYTVYSGRRSVFVHASDQCGWTAQGSAEVQFPIPSGDGSLAVSPDPILAGGVNAFLSYDLRGLDAASLADNRFNGTVSFLKTAVADPSYVNFSAAQSGSSITVNATVNYSTKRGDSDALNIHGLSGMTLNYSPNSDCRPSTTVIPSTSLSSVEFYGDGSQDVFSRSVLRPSPSCTVSGLVRKMVSNVSSCVGGSQVNQCTISTSLEFIFQCPLLVQGGVGPARRVEVSRGEGFFWLPTRQGQEFDATCPPPPAAPPGSPPGNPPPPPPGGGGGEPPTGPPSNPPSNPPAAPPGSPPTPE